MSEYLKQEDLEVLMQLHHFHTTGEAGPEPSRHAITRLEAERLHTCLYRYLTDPDRLALSRGLSRTGQR